MTVAAEQLHWSKPEPGHFLEIPDASWDVYESLLNHPDWQHIRITYDQGRLVAMSPLLIHERWKKLIGRMVETMTEVRNIPIVSASQTTWRRKMLRKGLEADECYYVQHEPQIRSKLKLAPSDPAPDLAIEIDYTHLPIDRAAIYAALGVPEVWRYDGKTLRAERLVITGDDRQYQPIENSLAFPFLKPRELERFLAMLPQTGETSIVRAWREWVAQIRDVS